MSIDYRKYGRKKRSASQQVTTFSEEQLKELKEAFSIMDRNKDGIVDRGDLKDFYAHIGVIPSDSMIDSMISECPGPINFATFLSNFGDRLMNAIDPEDTLIYAFQMYDRDEKGYLPEQMLKKILTTSSTKTSLIQYEPLSDAEIDEVYRGKPPISGGKLYYKDFAKMIVAAGE